MQKEVKTKNFYAALLFVVLSLFISAFLYFIPGLRHNFSDGTIPPSNQTLLGYVFTIMLLLFLVYSIYCWFYYKQKKSYLSLRSILLISFLFLLVLVGVFPLMSSDVLNYPLYTRIFTEYGENTYLMAPKEFPADIYYQKYINKNFENLTMPYGPAWLALSVFPTMLGGEKTILTLYLFKLLAVIANLGCIILVYKIVSILRPKLSGLATMLYAFNPFILFQVIVDGHNDIVMTFFVLAAIYLLVIRKMVWALIMLALSVLAKFISVLLLPIFIIYAWKKDYKKTLSGIVVAAIIALVLCLAYGLANLEAVNNIFSRGSVLYPPAFLIVLSILLRIVMLISVTSILFWFKLIAIILFLAVYVFLVSRPDKKREDSINMLISKCSWVYLLYFTLLCFLFWEWYLLWVLPLLLLVPNRSNIMLYFLLSLMGVLCIIVMVPLVSLIIIFLFTFWWLYFYYNDKKRHV